MPVLVVVERSVTPGHENKVVELIKEVCRKSKEYAGCSFARSWQATEEEPRPAWGTTMGTSSHWESYEHWLDFRSSSWYQAVSKELRAHQQGPEIIRVYRDYSLYTT
jgi:quinol monooxygenase YgiN